MDFASAEAASHLGAQVFGRKPKCLPAVWTRAVGISLLDLRAVRYEAEIGFAEFALHSLSDVLPVDLQFLATARTVNKQPDRYQFDQAFDLLKRKKCRHFHAVAFQFGVE